MQGIAWRNQKSNSLHLCSGQRIFFCLWHSCQPAECQRWMVDQVWLLVTYNSNDKNAMSLSLSVHRAGTAVLTKISLFNGLASSEKVALNVANPCFPPCPHLWRSLRREHLRACLLFRACSYWITCVPAFTCFSLSRFLSHWNSLTFLRHIDIFLRHWNAATGTHQGEVSLQPSLFPCLFISI